MLPQNADRGPCHGWGDYEEALHALRAHLTCDTACRHKAGAIGQLIHAMKAQSDEAFALLEDAMAQEPPVTRSLPLPRQSASPRIH